MLVSRLGSVLAFGSGRVGVGVGVGVGVVGVGVGWVVGVASASPPRKQLLAGHAEEVGRLDRECPRTKLIQRRDGSVEGLRHDVVADQEVVRMRDGRDHAVVGLLHRVGEVAGLKHLNVRLLMELVEQVYNGVDRGSRGVVELEVVQIVRDTDPIF